MSIKAWSDEETEALVDMYTNETTDVYEIAEKFGKKHRSVISKLVQLKIYQKEENDKKKTDTVKTMLREIEDLLDIEIEGTNLNKKSNLVNLVEALRHKVGN